MQPTLDWKGEPERRAGEHLPPGQARMRSRSGVS
jgi:hypothetical protein